MELSLHTKCAGLGNLTGLSRPIEQQKNPYWSVAAAGGIGALVAGLPTYLYNKATDTDPKHNRRRTLVAALLGASALALPSLSMANAISNKYKALEVSGQLQKKFASFLSLNPLAAEAMASIILDDNLPFLYRANALSQMNEGIDREQAANNKSLLATAAKTAVGALIGRQLAGWAAGIFSPSLVQPAKSAGLLGGAYAGTKW